MIRLDEQVAIVTGAGRGIGRAYARLLAERGATVVVNDIASEKGGTPRAQGLVDEISARGGRAVASTHNAASQKECADLVRSVADQFGRLDILVLNAGLTRFALREQSLLAATGFSNADINSVRAQFELQLMGTYYLGIPAWKLMEQHGYGRIILTTSFAIFGSWSDGSYGAAKNGLISLARTMNVEAERNGLNIKVNVISPSAATSPDQKAGQRDYKKVFADRNIPEMVAGAVCYLVSPECEFGGECFRVGGSYAGQNFIGMTRGWVHTGKDPFTPEEFQAHLNEITCRDGHIMPESGPATMDFMMSRVQEELAG